MNNENDSNDTILSSTNNNVENDFNFSEDYIDKTKRDLALKILNLVDINGFDDKKYAGHSLRSGFATTTAGSGASEWNIMAMTGHKSVDMVRRYIKEADLFKNNALNKILSKWKIY